MNGRLTQQCDGNTPDGRRGGSVQVGNIVSVVLYPLDCQKHALTPPRYSSSLPQSAIKRYCQDWTWINLDKSSAQTQIHQRTTWYCRTTSTLQRHVLAGTRNSKMSRISFAGEISDLIGSVAPSMGNDLNITLPSCWPWTGLASKQCQMRVP